MLYFFVGDSLRIGPAGRGPARGAGLVADGNWVTNTGATAVECLLLQGRPIGEPVAQYGPFVMNTQQEIMQAMNGTTAAPSLVAGPGRERPGARPRSAAFARYPARPEDEAPSLWPLGSAMGHSTIRERGARSPGDDNGFRSHPPAGAKALWSPDSSPRRR